MRTRPFFLRAATAILGLALVHASAQEAAPIVYDVELVVFRNLDGSATPEDWALEAREGEKPVRGAIQDAEEAPVIAVPAGTGLSGTGRQALPRDQYRLANIAASLQRSRGYRTVAHFGWSQVGSPLNAAVAEPIDSLVPPGTVSGSAALARGRYLHLTLDLDFQADPGGPHYVLRQTRRMRSTERHYFDHPHFGVIALVTPQAPAATR